MAHLLLGRRKVDFSHKLVKVFFLMCFALKSFPKFVLFCFVFLFGLMSFLNLSGQTELGAFFFDLVIFYIKIKWKNIWSHVWWFIEGSVPFSLWLAMDWYTLPIAPFTDWPVVLVCAASRSEPLSGDEVTPCNLPVDPLNDAAGVGRFFLSLKQQFKSQQ